MIRNQGFALISLVLFVVLGYYVFNRLLFLRNAERTTGDVSEITSTNSRCGGGRRSRSYPCTKFSAHVQYYVEGKQYILKLSAGRSRNHNQPNQYASYKAHELVKVIYDPSNPSYSFEDSFTGIWLGPITLFIAQMVTFIMSFVDSNRRKYSS